MHTMYNRISRVTTKTGDQGSTRLTFEHSINKGEAILELVGVLDEANSTLGVLVQYIDTPFIEELKRIQSRLFDVGAALATEVIQPYWQRETQHLTESIKELNRKLGPLKDFVLPGGGKSAAFAHLARTTVRRAERVFWRYGDDKLKKSGIGAYLNRVSDYLFVLSRAIAETEEIWCPLKN